MCVLVSSCMCACVWVLAYVRKVRTYIGASWAHNYKEAARTKTCGSEGTCLRVGSRWCAAQAACRQSPGWQWPVQLDSGPIYESWCVCVSVCVGVCGKQLLMPFYNSLFLFSVFFLVFSVLLPLHFTHNFAIILVSNVCNFIFHHSTRFCCCYMLHATCHHRNFELSSFFRLQPPIGTSSPIGFHTTEGADAACLSALFHLSFIFIGMYKKKMEENKNRTVRAVTDFVSLVGRKT